MNFQLSRSMHRILIALGASLLWMPGALAQPNYMVSEIPAPEWPARILLADMDGDGRQDLLVPHHSQEAGREILIYLQQANGRFSDQVSRHVEIKPEIVAVAVADVRAEPGQELLLFSNSAVFSLSSAVPSYTGNLKQLFSWNLAASVPDKRQFTFINDAVRVNANGFIDLLLPGQDTYGYFRGNSAESFTLVQEFSTINTELDPADIPLGIGRFNTNIDINERDGIILKVSTRHTSSFENMVSEWGTNASSETLLQNSNWMPAARMASLNRSDAADITFLNIGNDIRGQLNIIRQQTDGSFSATPDWQGPVDTRGEIRMLDFNGDGLQDIVRIVDESNDWDVYFYRNRGGSFNLDAPDQIMRFSGYDLNLSVVTLAANSPPVLSVSYYTIPVVNAIRNSSIIRTQLLYGATSSGNLIFNNRPDFKLDESFSAASVRGLSQQISFDADMNADGRPDALYLTAEGTLAAKSIDQSLRFSAQPFWQHVPARTITAFEVVDLNGDNVPDLILYHSSTASILVSTP